MTAIDPLALRAAFGRFQTGVCIVTGGTWDSPHGMTVNSFTSVSLDPPLVLWCAARAAKQHDAFAAAPFWSVHILGADQLDLCRRFTRGGAGFDDLPQHRSAEGVPILHGDNAPLARFDCAAHHIHDGGDHSILIGRVVRFTTTDPEKSGLGFANGRFGRFLPEA